MKKVLLAVFAFLLVGFFVQANAQDISNDALADVADVVITDITVNQNTQLTNGSKIDGTISFYNETDRFIPEFTYTIGLVDKTENDFAQVGKIILGPETINGKQVKKVNYSYTIPKSLPEGQSSLFVRTFSAGGRPGGRFVLPLSISKTDNLTFLVVKKAGVIVDEKAYSIQEGPTVSDTQLLKLMIGFGDQTLKEALTPHVVINDTQVGEKKILEQDLPAITVATSSYVFEYPVAIKELKSGVYSASISFLDKDGNQRAETIDFRFIKQGQISSIKEIIVSRDSLEKEESFNVVVDTLGAPYDIERQVQDALKNPNINIKVFNESGILIASHSGPIEIGTTLNIPMVASEKSAAIRVEAELKDGEALIDTYNLKHTDKFDEIVRQMENKAKIINMIVTLLVVIIAILLSIFFINKKKKLSTASIIPLIILAFAVSFIPSQSQAYTVLMDGGRQISVTVSNPLSAPGKYYQYREDIPFYIESSASACNNVDNSRSKLTVYNPTQTVPQQATGKDGELQYAKKTGTPIYDMNFLGSVGTLGSDSSGNASDDSTDHTVVHLKNKVSGNITDDLAPGTYRLYIKVTRTYTYNDGSEDVATEYGYQNFTVVDNTVIGACGSSNGQAYTTAPVTNLCSTGTASAVTTNSTTYTWSCTGSNTSATTDDVSCSATRNVCSNGSTDYPTCTSNVCANGATNYPDCNVCTINQQLCNEQCIPLGQCCGDNQCQSGEICNNGTCTVDVCDNLTGAQVSCPAGYTCSSGQCTEGPSCPTGSIRCDGQCVSGSTCPVVPPNGNGDNSGNGNTGGGANTTGNTIIETYVVTPQIVNKGAQCILEWGVKNSASKPVTCTITGGRQSFINVVNTILDFTTETGSIQSSTDFTLTCTDASEPAKSEAETVKCVVNPNILEF